jgi:hypothetical protein
MVNRDDKKNFQKGDMVYIVPRFKRNTKISARRHFKERKWGPAKIIGILLENKINVEFVGKINYHIWLGSNKNQERVILFKEGELGLPLC